MASIIISVIVSLLEFFIKLWWTAHHPVNPAPARTAFIDEVGRTRHFFLGRKRKEYAGKLFDKFLANYNSRPPKVSDQDTPLTSEQAGAIAKFYTSDLTLGKDEL